MNDQCRKYNRYNDIGVHDVVAEIADNDISHVNVSNTMLEVAEGGLMSSYKLVLLTEPWGDVVVRTRTDVDCYRECGYAMDETDAQGRGCGDSTSGLMCNGTVDTFEYTFTPANWGMPQTVTVRAYDDHLDEHTPHAFTISHEARSIDGGYHGLTIDNTTVSVVDNDESQVQVSRLALDVAEGGATDEYTIRLSTEPWADVVVHLHTDGDCYRP